MQLDHSSLYILFFLSQMHIEARRGNGPFGDIAVDDFRVRDGACPAEGDCDFEHLDFCSWTQETGKSFFNDTFDWIIGSGKTSSYFTGPSIDHTTQSAGGNYSRSFSEFISSF